jgi:hypothetical protein
MSPISIFRLARAARGVADRTWRLACAAAIPTLLIGAPSSLSAAPVTFSSGSNRVALIELFTSEGCSSCPPAERWLGARTTDRGLWQTFVPVEFHVDYWNRLGWPDRFSSREFTDREYRYADSWGSGSVYTPCFVRNGAEWHPADSAAPAPDAVAAGVLTVHYDGAVVTAEFAPATRVSVVKLELHAALLVGGVVSKVAAGENQGTTLRHEFVAAILAQGPLSGPVALPRREVSGAQRRALAVWVTKRGDLEPLQATGGWLEP